MGKTVKAEFLTDLIVREVDNERYELQTVLEYRSPLYAKFQRKNRIPVEPGREGVITAPPHFVCDLESVPRLIPFAYAWIKGRIKRAGAIHDWGFSAVLGMTRRQWDLILREAIFAIAVEERAEGNIGRFGYWNYRAMAEVVYGIVRVSGWAAWNSHRKAKDEVKAEALLSAYQRA